MARQGRRKKIEVSTSSSLYLREKALEEEYPGVGFRDAAEGREAYILGHQVAVWEVEDVHRETGDVEKIARHFRWPAGLVRCALAFAAAFSEEVAAQRVAEAGA